MGLIWALLLHVCRKRREKKQILTTHKTFMKTHIVPEKNISYMLSIESLLFELKGVGWDLLMMRLVNKLTKRTSTKITYINLDQTNSGDTMTNVQQTRWKLLDQYKN